MENGQPRSRVWGGSPPGAADVSSRGDPVTHPSRVTWAFHSQGRLGVSEPVLLASSF